MIRCVFVHMNYINTDKHINFAFENGQISIFFFVIFGSCFSCQILLLQVGWDTPAAVHANEASIIRYEALGDGNDLQ